MHIIFYYIFTVYNYSLYYNVLADAKYKYHTNVSLLMETNTKIGTSAGGLLDWHSTNCISLDVMFSVLGSADPGGE